ncbi:unnamed protein product [Amoebophrya sp. A120]|nr:unnamed protein product [Amoebophrya sp. A120]|eukprot:GSA120T00002603001.1
MSTADSMAYEVLVASAPLLLYFGPAQLFCQLRKQEEKNKRQREQEANKGAETTGVSGKKCSGFLGDGTELTGHFSDDAEVGQMGGRYNSTVAPAPGTEKNDVDSLSSRTTPHESKKCQIRADFLRKLDEEAEPNLSEDALLQMKNHRSENDFTASTTDTLVVGRPGLAEVFPLSPTPSSGELVIAENLLHHADQAEDEEVARLQVVTVLPGVDPEKENINFPEMVDEVDVCSAQSVSAPCTPTVERLPREASCSTRYGEEQQISTADSEEIITRADHSCAEEKQKLETPPLQFVAQCANGWTWLCFSILEGMRELTAPCVVQVLTGFLWLFLYCQCYRADLYRRQLRFLLVSLGCYLTLLGVFFGFALAESHGYVRGTLLEAKEPERVAHERTEFSRAVQATIGFFGTVTFATLMGSPAVYAYRAYCERNALLMGSWCSNAAGVFVCTIWANHGLSEGILTIAIVNMLSVAFSFVCLLLRLWLYCSEKGRSSATGGKCV